MGKKSTPSEQLHDNQGSVTAKINETNKNDLEFAELFYPVMNNAI